MTVSTTANKIQYDGDDLSVAFSAPFLFFDEAHLVVILTSAAGVDALQSLTTHYTVSGEGDPAGGTVTMVTAPATSEVLTIKREVPLTQPTDYVNPNKIDLEVLEQDLDENVMMAQQLKEITDRSIKLGEASELGEQILPDPNPDFYLGWNSGGTGLENKEAVPGATPIAINPGEAADIAVIDSAEIGLESGGKTFLELLRASGAADSGAVNAYVVALDPAPTAYTAYQVVHFKPANTNTGPSTLNLNALSAKTIKRPDGNGLKPGDIAANIMAVCVYEGASFVLVNPAKAAFQKKYLEGMLISNGTDTDHDLDISAGSCRAFGDDGDMVASALAGKQADQTTGWAEGAAASGMPITTKSGTYTCTGTAVAGTSSAFDTEFAEGDILWDTGGVEGRVLASVTDANNMVLVSAFSVDPSGETVKKGGIAPNARYDVFALGKVADPSDVDIGIDTDANADELLAAAQAVDADWTLYKRIGSIVTDSSSNILAFVMKEFTSGLRITDLDVPVNDITTATQGATATTWDMTCPKNTPCLLRVNKRIRHTSAQRGDILFPTDITETAPQVDGTAPGTTTQTDSSGNVEAVGLVVARVEGGQLKLLADGANTIATVNTLGWME